ncbi:M24 family metallopeptidase [Clostridium cellulovorans]|uniref:Peptidase M24 n=1 Tax=Clostridium cellulovorans (strain ATCC 35296 / DSM 3052 / OCM 3 / 743B) TaxID=573061 RepID=D9SLE8_CLOC7|nr:Xaa-Pro peptidase family protein [Clostridium cellulovorans]ADL51664.1 peptidase M24 [Clostridium cellulovorans 743B]
MYNERLNNLRKKTKEKNLDAVLLVGDYNRNYITGFTGDESYALITGDKAYFITDSRYAEQGKQQVKGFEILQYSTPLAKYLSNLLEELAVKNLGFEDNVLSYNQYETFKNAFNCELVPLKGMVEELRLIKDSVEIQNIREAAKIADLGFSHMLNYIKLGMTEKQIALELEFFMRKQGASSTSFNTIVASGVRSALPHGVASDKVIEANEIITMDFGCIYNGYCSDMTRTIAIGKPDGKIIDIYNVVLEAQTRALKEIKEGVTGQYLDKIARDYIIDKGYGKYFGHGLGHGVGVEIHEEPRLNPTSTTIMKAGMIITDEPGIYIPDLGGVRIEDLILVTEDGCEVLSKSPKELICL